MNGEPSAANWSGGKGPARGLLFAIYLLFGGVIPLSGQIQDNSFLLEEAYNQEAGVVQHINNFTKSSGGSWAYSFTQEWPIGGIDHQLSYTILLAHVEPSGTGFGDLGLNYRYQLLGNPKARTIMAPRFTLLFPTGDEEADRGTGGLGLQANLPLTLVFSSALTTHWNAGGTLVPSASDPTGDRATTFSPWIGGSVIWALRPWVNLLVETLWLSRELTVGEGQTGRESTTLLSPGLRAAIDLKGGLQIVPGVAYTVGLSSDEDNALFLYLSFEHPFKGQ